MKKIVAIISIMICVVLAGKAQMSINNNYNLNKSTSIKNLTDIPQTISLSSRNKIAFFSTTNTVKLSNSELIKLLRDSLKNEDSIELQKQIRTYIDTLKLDNTNAFLTPYKHTSFWLKNIGNYNIDSLNKYLNNQTTFNILENIAFQNFGAGNQFIRTEIGSYMFGPVKLGVSTSIKTQTDTAKDAKAKVENSVQSNIKRIITNGGAININATVPLYFTRAAKDITHFGVYGQTNFVFLPSVLDTSVADIYKSTQFKFLNQTGLLIHLDILDNSKSAKFSFDLNTFYCFGTKDTYNELGITDFFIVKAHAALELNDIFSIHVSGPLFCTSQTIKDGAPFTLSFGFSPSQVIKSSNQSNSTNN